MAEASQLTAHLAARVKQLRGARGWTAVELGERLTKLGIRWDRFTVTSLENGKRQNVTVDELLALARVFDVAPVHMLVPFGDGSAPVTPVESQPPSDVRAWIRGERPLPGTNERIFRSEVPLDELRPRTA